MNVTRLILNSVLIIIACLLSYMLWQTIRRPIDFKETRAAREEKVRAKLLEISQLQKMYKDLTDTFANSFDTLKMVLTTGTFKIQRVLGDKYDTTQVVTVDTVSIPAIDSLRNFVKKTGSTLDLEGYFANLSKVPQFNNLPIADFSIKSGKAQVEGMDSLMQPAFEVGTPIGAYMSDYPETDYNIYDPDYKITNIRKVGDITKPNKLSGNW